MKDKHFGLLALCIGIGLALVWVVIPGLAQGSEPGAAPSTTAPLGSAITYQGQLQLDGHPVEEVCDFRFSLWDAGSGGSQVGSTLTRTAVPVEKGLFTIPNLDFEASAFSGPARWLAIDVRCPAGSGSYAQLAGRQPLTPAPYALYAPQAGSAPWSGLTGVPSGFADGVDNNTTYTAGDGLDLTGNQFSVLFAGSGVTTTVARSDHDHWGQHWLGDDLALYLESTPHFVNSSVIHIKSGENMGVGLEGVVAATNSDSGMLIPTGVAGINTAPAGGWANMAVGVYGAASYADNAFGVYGTAPLTGTAGFSSSQQGVGVFGKSSGGGSTGVQGVGGYNGVSGRATQVNGNGVVGQAEGFAGYGVWGISTDGYAGYFSGDVHISGNLSKLGGSFKIDHPLDPANKYLYHSFVESPDMKNIYDGVAVLDASGEAVVVLPDWFEALNRDFRYQLTTIGGFAPVFIAEEIANNQFKIAGGTPGLKVSWQVTGIRQDAWANDHRIPVEEQKPPEEVGTYLYPEGFGASQAQSPEQQRLAGQQARMDASASSLEETNPYQLHEVVPAP